MRVISLPNGRPWLETVFNHGKTMVEHNLSTVLSPGVRPISFLILVVFTAISSFLRVMGVAKSS